MPFAPLRNVRTFAEQIERVINRPPSLPGLACFFGPSGYGKSSSAVWAIDKFDAAYIECGQYTTAKSMLTDILFELGVNKPKGTIIEMQNHVINLMAQNPQAPLLVDEAHYVADRAFVNVLGEICRKSGAPMVLIGEEVLPQKLERFDRVHNYILDWQPAEPSDENDFAHLLRVTFSGLQIDDELAKAILTRTGGNTRRICVNLAKAQEIAKHNKNAAVTLSDFGGEGAINIARSFSPRRARS